MAFRHVFILCRQELFRPSQEPIEDKDKNGQEMTLELYRLSTRRIHLSIKVSFWAAEHRHSIGTLARIEAIAKKSFSLIRSRLLRLVAKLSRLKNHFRPGPRPRLPNNGAWRSRTGRGGRSLRMTSMTHWRTQRSRLSRGQLSALFKMEAPSRCRRKPLLVRFLMHLLLGRQDLLLQFQPPR